MFADFDWIQAMRNSPVMLIIVACSIVTLGFALERLLYFSRRRGDAARLMGQALDQVRRGQLREAGWALNTSKHPVGPVAAQVIENRNLSPEAQEEKLQIALSQQRLLFERHLGWLGTMGNTAPLIGLLGTVWGIMRAFHDMARTGSAGPSVVAAGVAEALFTTAAGLLVAVPSVMLYNHFVRKTHVMLTEAENHARDLRLSLDGAGAEQTSNRSNVKAA
jgi:biopolymer transport protein ExbB